MEQFDLIVMQCPSCGANLNVSKDSSGKGIGEMECVYCGSTVRPVQQGSVDKAQGDISSVRIDGIKTAASVLAYMEDYFDSYDWESFSYSESLTVPHVMNIVNNIKNVSADDKNTWLAMFCAVYTPFVKKAEYCKEMAGRISEQYKTDSLGAYSRFDAYVKVASIINGSKNAVIADLNKYVAKAEKYKAEKDELNKLSSLISELEKAENIPVYDSLESIPDVAAYIEWKDREIEMRLQSQGVDAPSEYTRALSLVESKQYVAALNVLTLLEGYKDCDSIARKINKYFLIDDVLEICGKLYIFKRSSEENGSLSLYPAGENGIGNKAIVKGIRQIITNYADVLYYIADNKKICKFDFATGTLGEKVGKEKFSCDHIRAHGHKCYLMSDAEEGASRTYYELDLASASLKPILTDITEFKSFIGNKLAVNRTIKTVNGRETVITILNVDSGESLVINDPSVTLRGYMGDSVIYTVPAPNMSNQDLLVRGFDGEPATVVERNIYDYFDTIDGKLFYYVGGPRAKTMVTADRYGMNRKEWPVWASRFLFHNGGWIYFERKIDHNGVICRSRTDGSCKTVVASNINRYLNIINGYLYYIDYSNRLMRVRMDGSNQQMLCKNVEDSLIIKEKEIVFVSVDSITRSAFTNELNTVRSIYHVDFTGGGLSKLVYDVNEAQKYDEDTVYFTKTTGRFTDDGHPIKTLHKLDVKTRTHWQLFTFSNDVKKSTPVGFIVAMVIAAILLLFAVIGLLGESSAMMLIGLIGAVISVIIGIVIKKS